MSKILLAILILIVGNLAVIGLATIIFLVSVICIKEDDPYERK